MTRFSKTYNSFYLCSNVGESSLVWWGTGPTSPALRHRPNSLAWSGLWLGLVTCRTSAQSDQWPVAVMSHTFNSLKWLQCIGTGTDQRTQLTARLYARRAMQFFRGPRQSLSHWRHGFRNYFWLDRLYSSRRLPRLWLRAFLWWRRRRLTGFRQMNGVRQMNNAGGQNVLGLGRRSHVTIWCSTQLPHLWLSCKASCSWRTQS